MRYNYNKLVRDNIPNEISKKQNSYCKYRILDNCEYTKELDKKLQEESNEFIESHSIEEMADLMEVIEAIIKNSGFKMEDIIKAKNKKNDLKGKFEDKIYLEYVDEERDEKEEKNFVNKQLSLLNLLRKNDSLSDIQKYVMQVSSIRGFYNQPVQDELLLLTEEVGELAKSVRKDYTKMKIDSKKIEHYENIENEIADVFFVLTTICNSLNIDLLQALKNKEAENCKRQWN